MGVRVLTQSENPCVSEVGPPHVRGRTWIEGTGVPEPPSDGSRIQLLTCLIPPKVSLNLSARPPTHVCGIICSDFSLGKGVSLLFNLSTEFLIW